MKILLVDDQPDILEITKDLLELRGHEVLVAPGAHEAILHLKTFGRVDAIVSDFEMPDSNGEELRYEIEKIFQACPPFIIHTGCVNPVWKYPTTPQKIYATFHKTDLEGLFKALDSINENSSKRRE